MQGRHGQPFYKPLPYMKKYMYGNLAFECSAFLFFHPLLVFVSYACVIKMHPFANANVENSWCYVFGIRFDFAWMNWNQNCLNISELISLKHFLTGVAVVCAVYIKLPFQFSAKVKRDKTLCASTRYKWRGLPTSCDQYIGPGGENTVTIDVRYCRARLSIGTHFSTLSPILAFLLICAFVVHGVIIIVSLAIILHFTFIQTVRSQTFENN